MARIFVIGSTGGVGHRLCPMLVGAGHQVVALHRKPEQADGLRSAGCEPVLGDLMGMSPADLATASKECDVIVFSAGAAGSGLDRTTAIDGDGPGKVIAAAHLNGIRRFYLVSAFPEAGRGQQPKPGFEHYMEEKKRADAAVTASDLDWVILRPGTLLHEDGDGQVALGWALPYGSVARGNVARVLHHLIETPLIRREILELTDGATPVDRAVAQMVRGA